MKVNNPSTYYKKKRIQKELMDNLQKISFNINSRSPKYNMRFYCGLETYNKLPNWMKNESK